VTTLVLVHGAFRGAWAWAPTLDRLAALGVDAVAVDLLGAGDRWEPDAVPASLEQTAADLVRQADDVRDDVVLVGHSQGSLVIAAALAAPPARLVGVAHLDGAVPDPGECACDLLGAPAPPRDLVIQPPPPDPMLPADAQALVAERTRPQHAALACDPVPVPVVEVPVAWAFCRHTPGGYPSAVVRERLGVRGVDHVLIDAPHDAPLVAPEAVANWLVTVVLSRCAGVDTGGDTDVP
jgi:pimeloyl-ACP methyl ester carboxylesterase